MFGFKKLSKKLLCGAAVAVLAIGLIAGCGSDTSNSAGGDKVLRVGAETTFPPFEFTNDKGEYIGFDIDLSRAIAEKMGYKFEFKSMGFDALIPALQAKNIDIIASGLNPTPERAKVVTFSAPYFTDGGFVLVVKKDSPITSLADVKGKPVAVQIGTVPVDIATKAGAQPVQVNSDPEMITQVQTGKSVGLIIDKAVAMYYLKQGADKDLKIVGQPIGAEPYVMAMRLHDDQLQKQVNNALNELKKDGTYAKIYKKWFGTEPKD